MLKKQEILLGKGTQVESRGYSLVAVHRLLISVASIFVEHSDTWTSRVAAHGL